jgi:hypothetical protein
MLTLCDRLILTADAYCAAVGRSRSRISTLVFGDGMRLDGIARGKDIQTRNYERAMRWFAENWPEGVAWPEGVERPDPEQAAPRPGAAA